MEVLAPRGYVGELIYPKALKPGPVKIRIAEKKRIRYDSQDEALLSLGHFQDQLIRGQATVVFAEMNEEAAVCCMKDREKSLGS